MTKINPNGIYTTGETQILLRVSRSTIKRFLKHGIIRANKLGGQYRILGKELLRILSPRMERGVVARYGDLKRTIKAKTKDW